MAAQEQGGGLSMTPTQRVGFKHTSRKSDELTGFGRQLLKERSLSGSSSQHAGKSLLSAPPSIPPGSFSTELRTTGQPRSTTPWTDIPTQAPKRTSRDDDGKSTTEQRQAIMRDAITKELKIRMGTENMLDALLSKNNKQTREQRLKVEQELGTSNRKLAELRLELDQEIKRAQSPVTPPRKAMSGYFEGSPRKAQSTADTPITEFPAAIHDDESPTVVLTDTLQALEIEGMQPDYYIERANRLVELFKRNPTLKYDLAWPIFSLRVQVMLLSESTEVVAAGYRLTRHAIADRTSLKTIRSLHTDELVTLSLVKKGSKALLEREQAVKLVRSFLDVKDGVQEIALSVLRSLVAVAEHKEDRLNSICMLTLSEVLAKHPSLLVSANGLNTLTDALAEGSFAAPEAIVTSFLHILDHPHYRRFLSSGRELEAVFAPFTDPLMLNGDEQRLRICAKAISAMLKTWPGFLTLSSNNAQSLRSLIESLVYPDTFTRDLILELFFDVLRIKSRSWSSQFLAGRRLTQYGRMARMKDGKSERNVIADSDGRFDLTAHFSTLLLAVLLRCGLVPALIRLIQGEEDEPLKRKATLLLTEVLKLAYRSLPDHFSAHLQVLGDLMSPETNRDPEARLTNTNVIYQIDSINRAVNLDLGGRSSKGFSESGLVVGAQIMEKTKFSAVMDGDSFRQAVMDSQVLSHHSFSKWKWDVINDLIAGPLTNPKRVDELLKSTKFLKRLTGFYRPFKYRFSGLSRIGPNQRYVKTGCALIRTLTQTTIGLQFLRESKLLRQLAECLAQLDPMSGLTSSNPLFDKYQMEETLSGGYFALLGALSESSDGIHIMERWHMMNMFYHIVERDDREDLVKAFLGHMDFTLDTHLRVLLSKSLTSAHKNVRLFATKLLRKYAVGRVHYSAGLQDPTSSHWALRLVLTQLYDPDVEVCEMAVKILEEACDQRSHLEYVVKCRPALDHLGEIGAPLLLRFLSTSTGYRYLDGLDYITQEMDDWFLGRNDAYVATVEASLARAYLDQGHSKLSYTEEPADIEDSGLLPPHFYRELARTEEGCRLLRQSGHFYEFSATIRDFNLSEEEYESLVRIKACLWAVGNIGSMPLGAPFLEESDVVNSMVRIAQGADVMSVRGTACFAVGLLSRSLHGSQMLADCGWDTTVNPEGHLTGLCVPRDIFRLCLKEFGTTREPKVIDKDGLARFHSAVNDTDPINARILKNIVDMGNSVMYKKAAGELHGLKSKHLGAFADVVLFRKTLFILESHHYRLQARQFILDLFDKSVMRRIVFEMDTEDDTESDST